MAALFPVGSNPEAMCVVYVSERIQPAYSRMKHFLPVMDQLAGVRPL